MVRELVGEVVGMAPYEKRLLDMLKTGGASSEKRMYKFAKRRVSASHYKQTLECICKNLFSSRSGCVIVGNPQESVEEARAG